MKFRFSLISATAIAALSSCSADVKPAIPVDREIEAKVARTLRGMTLEEKAGQLMQINADRIMDAAGNLTPWADTVLGKYKVGSILNTPGGRAVSPETYARVIRDIQEISMRETGIPCIYGLDMIHGATYASGTTFFPQEINLAATFDVRFARAMGRVAAYETRACNVPWVFCPVMDLGRNPVWPRVWESYGEDAYLNSRMAVEEVLAMQGEDPNHIGMQNVAVSLKHFMCYGVPVSGQDRTPSSVTASDMREKYFMPFMNCLKAGALNIMVNSAMNNGVPFHANRELLTGWVKEGLNWDGMIVTDWADVRNLYERDHVAASNKDAVAIAINAGIDMIMEPYHLEVCDEIVELVKEGRISQKRLDDAVSRVLRMKYRLGLFDKPYWDCADYDQIACEESVKASYAAALESEVLLKNEGLLPLDRSARILVTGPNANSMRTLNGGWSYTWQGDGADLPEFTGQYNTIVEALQNKFSNVQYVPSVRYEGKNWQDETGDCAAAVAAARNADVIIACIGENTYCETPGNITDLTLSENQRNLVKALAATGKPVVLILNEGRPRVIRDIEPLAGAVVDIFLPSNYGADALAALLCGEENFSGKMPLTYPKYANRPATYDYKLCENRATMGGAYNYDAVMDVQWPFGFGLSYTSFKYSGIKVDRDTFKSGDVINVSVDVTNTGAVAGKESVLLFSSDLVASSTPDVRRLRGFDKIELQPGETRTVTIALEADELAFVDRDGHWTLEEGEFRLAMGTESVVVNCSKTRVWKTQNK